MTGNRYLQVDVATASPALLVSRLLARAVASIRRARAVDPAAEGAERTRSLSRAVAVVAELRSAIDLERGGEVARNLDAVYEFVNHRLLTASLEPDPGVLDEALRPLEIVASAWNEISGPTPEGNGS